MIGLTANLNAQIESLERENKMRIAWNNELERRLAIAYEALKGIAGETGTPYGRDAQAALDDMAKAICPECGK